jgi:glycosyl transferase family 25
MQKINYFEKIYIINLPFRTDRKKEILEQLIKIGLNFESPNVELFSAIRPDSQDGFTSIGAKGCFMSHLEILKKSSEAGFNRILILEDDLNFCGDFINRIDKVIDHLKENHWSIFYGGYEIPPAVSKYFNSGVIDVPPDFPIGTTHFIAFQKSAIQQLINYLNLLLSREAGDPRGGPMHVDGAYCWFRNKYPEMKTLISIPILGYQRPSRTDIHALKWYDRYPFISGFIDLIRKLKAIRSPK